MWNVLAIIGGVLGLGSAALLHAGFGRLRPHPPVFFQFLGWLVAAGLSWYGGALFLNYLSYPEDPMSTLFLFLAVLTCVPVLICAALGSLQARTFPMAWTAAFSLLMAEFGLTLATIVFLYSSLDAIAEIIRHFNWGVGEPFAVALHLVNCFAVSLFTMFVLLKSIPAWPGQSE